MYYLKILGLVLTICSMSWGKLDEIGYLKSLDKEEYYLVEFHSIEGNPYSIYKDTLTVEEMRQTWKDSLLYAAKNARFIAKGHALSYHNSLEKDSLEMLQYLHNWEGYNPKEHIYPEFTRQWWNNFKIDELYVNDINWSSDSMPLRYDSVGSDVPFVMLFKDTLNLHAISYSIYTHVDENDEIQLCYHSAYDICEPWEWFKAQIPNPLTSKKQNLPRHIPGISYSTTPHELIVSTTLNQAGVVKVMDSQGKVKHQHQGSLNHRVSLEGWSSGVYRFQVLTESGKLMQNSFKLGDR